MLAHTVPSSHMRIVKLTMGDVDIFMNSMFERSTQPSLSLLLVTCYRHRHLCASSQLATAANQQTEISQKQRLMSGSPRHPTSVSLVPLTAASQLAHTKEYKYWGRCHTSGRFDHPMPLLKAQLALFSGRVIASGNSYQKTPFHGSYTSPLDVKKRLATTPVSQPRFLWWKSHDLRDFPLVKTWRNGLDSPSSPPCLCDTEISLCPVVGRVISHVASLAGGSASASTCTETLTPASARQNCRI
jgi:hypothetical protein